MTVAYRRILLKLSGEADYRNYFFGEEASFAAIRLQAALVALELLMP